MQTAATQQQQQRSPSPVMSSPVWLSRHLDGGAGKALLESSSDNLSKNHSADEEDVDTDLETDRLLGHQRLDDQGYYDENKSWDRKTRSSLLSKISPKQQQVPSTKTRNGYNALLSSTPELPPPIPPKSGSGVGAGVGSGAAKLLDLVSSSVQHMQRSTSRSSSERSGKSPIKVTGTDICGMSAATAAEVVASAVVASAAAAAGNLPNLGSPNNGGGSERSAPSVIKLDVDLNGGVGGIINGGTVPTVNATANGSAIVNANQNGASNGSTNNISVNNNNINNGSSSNGSATNNNNNNNINPNSNGNSNGNNNNVAVGSNNGSSGSGAGSNSNSGEKKVKKSKSKEGKCLAWVYPSRSIVAILVYRNCTIIIIIIIVYRISYISYRKLCRLFRQLAAQ